jgi:hypothetical protein
MRKEQFGTTSIQLPVQSGNMWNLANVVYISSIRSLITIDHISRPCRQAEKRVETTWIYADRALGREDIKNQSIEQDESPSRIIHHDTLKEEYEYRGGLHRN